MSNLWTDQTEELSSAQAYADKMAFDRWARDRVDLLPDAPEYCMISDDGFVDFNFHPGQTQIMQCRKRIIVALAGRQGAKTSSCAPWLLEEMRARGPGLYMAVAPSFPILEDSLLPKIVDLFQDKLELGKTKTRPFSFIVSPEGEKILFEGTKWEKDAGSGKLPRTLIRFCHARNAASLEAKTALACVFDEAGQEEVPVGAIEAIEGRLTTTQGRLLLSTTPYVIGWLYRRYYLPWEQAKSRGEDHPEVEVIRWPSYLNPAFPKSEYDRQKKLMPPWKHAMFYDGLFTRAAGQIYDCFEDVHNTCAPFQIPDHWPRYMGQDYGGSNTSAVYLAEDPDSGKLYLYRAYLDGNMNEHEHKQKMTAPSDWCADNSLFDRVAGGAPSEDVWRDLYRRAGIYVEKPPLVGGGAVEAGIDCVYSVLARRQLVIFTSEEETIHEINTYSREIDPETGDVISGTIRDKNTFHRLDALRYIVSTLMRGRSDGLMKMNREGGIDPRYSQMGESFRDKIIAIPSNELSLPGMAALPMPMNLIGLPAPDWS